LALDHDWRLSDSPNGPDDAIRATWDCVTKDLQVGFQMNDAPTTSAGKLAAMLDYGWTLCGLANSFNIEVKEVERLIVEHVRRDREERRKQ
jgi:hypothetical protein